MRVTLGNLCVESGIPAEISFQTDNGDKALCVFPDDPATQEKWAREGSVIRVRGKLRMFRRPTNDGEFDAFLYYSQIRGCLFSLRDAHILAYTQTANPVRSRLYEARRSLSGALDAVYGAPEDSGTANIMKAMLLGQTGLLDEELKSQYQSAGIIHVLCISGLHLSLIGSGIFFLLRKAGIPLPAACAVSAFLIFLYGLMTGMHTSCVRAMIMFSFQIAAKALGRTYDPMTALAAAAVLLLIEQPAYLFHSGFLFSFTAVLAITLVLEAFPRRTAPFMIPICTLPVQLSFYYTFPLYSVFLNLVVITLAPFLIAAGILSLLPYMTASALSDSAPVLSDLIFSFSRLTGRIPVMILRLFDLLCEAAKRLPFHTLIPGRPALWLVIVYYLLIAVSTIAGIYRQDNGFQRHKTAILQLVLVTAAVAMIFGIRYRSPFTLYMWNVGQGDGLCMMTHDESGDLCILIDGGSSSRQEIGKYVEIPFLKYHGVSRIDCCIVTHDDLDHCSGVLELLRQHGEPDGIRIGAVALPSVTEKCKGKLYLQIESEAGKKGIPLLYLSRGMALCKGPLSLECIHPGRNAEYSDANACSTVLLVRYRAFSAVLTGDLEGEGEQDLIDYLGQQRIRADILKVAHHGSAGGTSQEFLRKVGAATAIISCGKDNPYGHPSPETVSRLLKAGMKLYDTRTTGQISILTDGVRGYSVETFCK